MTIKPVGKNEEHKVVLTVEPATGKGAPAEGSSTEEEPVTNEGSSLHNLVVEPHAKLELVLKADLTVDSFTLGTDSELVVSGTGTLIVNGAFISEGTVALNGGMIKANQGLSAVDLSLRNTTIDAVDAGKNAITATGTLSMEKSKVEHVSLFGYTAADGDKSVKAIILSGSNNEFNNVTVVGCKADSSLIVPVEGINTVTTSIDTTYYCDYSIKYQYDTDVALPEGEPSVTYYRVSSDSNNFNSARILGYHTNSEYVPEVTEISLPMLSKPGYEFQGWKVNDTDEFIKKLDAVKGNITLTAELVAHKVNVNLDLGFTPSEYTNDKDAEGNLPSQKSVLNSEVDRTVPLPVPARFGYVFKGWMVTNGENQKLIPYIGAGADFYYPVALDDCKVDEEGKLTVDEEGNYIVAMEAKWEEDKFGLTLFLGGRVDDVNNLKISVDGGKTFQNLGGLTG